MKCLLFVLLLIPLSVQSTVLATARQGGISVSLTDEKCKLVAVKNLPFRAIWNEVKGDKKAKVEGCWAFALGKAVVVLYFNDQTVDVVPSQTFEAATEI